MNLSTPLGLNTEESKLKERNTMEFDFLCVMLLDKTQGEVLC